VATAALVVEVLSPSDESLAKLPLRRARQRGPTTVLRVLPGCGELARRTLLRCSAP